MKKIHKKIALLLVVALCICSLSNAGQRNVTAQGKKGVSALGTNVDSFLAVIDSPDASAVRITTAQELNNIRNDMYGSYILMNDIDMSSYGDWDPIGTTKANAFHGKFDGQGHIIKGLQVTESFNSGSLVGVSYVAGLFGVCDNAEIKNVRLVDADVSIQTTSGYQYSTTITSDYSVYAGAISGYICNRTMIYNCSASGHVSASATGEGASNSVAGGLVGGADIGVISYSHNECEIEVVNKNALQSYNAYAGGLAGVTNKELVIDYSYNDGFSGAQTGDYGNAYAGGLAGAALNGYFRITNSFNAGDILGTSGNLFCDDSYAGGVVGVFKGTIENVYNGGDVFASVVDPYSIGGGKAYAGGVCCISNDAATISNSASLASTVYGTAKGAVTTNRISQGGIKTKNLTVDKIVKGNNNDADYVIDEETIKTKEPYIDFLGWDFDKTWEFAKGYDFPRLRQVKAQSEEYADEYVAQHMAYIDGQSYANILSNERWAQIYWSEENNLASNTAEKLYDFVDVAVDLLSLDFGFLFEDNNPYDIILVDYLSDQKVQDELMTLYKVEIPEILTKTYSKVEGFIEEHWEDAWGELSEEQLFYLFHYNERPSEEWINLDFQKHLGDIVDKEGGAGTFEKILGIGKETLDTILKEKKHLDNTIDWLNGLLEYAACINAYTKINDEFKTILDRMCDHLPEGTTQECEYKRQLKKSIKKYTQYNSNENIELKVYREYIANSIIGSVRDSLEKIITKKITEKVTDWIAATFSASVVKGLNKIGWAAGVGWKISEYITKNGELQNCREMLRANAYFESAMYATLKSVESDFRTDSTKENAKLFDVAFKFFKETELYSMDTCITYCDTYQTSWVQAIKNASNTFMNSFINEVHVHKLFLYRAYCHGKTYLSGGKMIVIACPTDVFLYNEDGILVSSIENNLVTKCNSEVLAYTADSIKIFAVPSDQNYGIKISATDNGKMNYSVSEYDSEMNYNKTVLFSDIEIHKGASYTGNIDKDYCANPEDYSLTGSDGKIIDEYQLMTEDNNLPVTDIKVAGMPGELNIGESVSPKVNIVPDNATVKTIVWESSNSDIATVTESGCITALSAGEVYISVKSIYGGISKRFPMVVKGGNLPVPTTPQPPIVSPATSSAPTVSPTASSTSTVSPTTSSIPTVTPATSSTPTGPQSSPNLTNPPTHTAEPTWTWLPVHTPMLVPQSTSSPTQTMRPAAIAPSSTSIPTTTAQVPNTAITEAPIITPKPSSSLVPEVTQTSHPGDTATPEIDESDEPYPAHKPSDNYVDNPESIAKKSTVKFYKDRKTNAYYRIVSKKNKTVAYVKPTNKKLRTTKIATSVKIKGEKYEVIKIAANAFKGCKKLHRVEMGNNIKSIGKKAFKNCKNLNIVKLDKKLIIIGADAFNNCTELKQVKFPARLKKIGIRAFKGCKKLKKLQFLTDKLNYNRVGIKAFKGIHPYAWVQCHEKKWMYYQKLFESRGMTQATIFNINL